MWRQNCFRLLQVTQRSNKFRNHIWKFLGRQYNPMSAFTSWTGTCAVTYVLYVLEKHFVRQQSGNGRAEHSGGKRRISCGWYGNGCRGLCCPLSGLDFLTWGYPPFSRPHFLTWAVQICTSNFGGKSSNNSILLGFMEADLSIHCCRTRCDIVKGLSISSAAGQPMKISRDPLLALMAILE